MKEMFQIEIPFEKFNEEEIQIIIATLFHSLEYHINYLHISDRANENGADIVVKKGKKNIAIAVKIKPNQKDRYQLLDLSRRKEKKKYYIYIQTPTSKFFESIKRDGKNITFFDKKKINDFFIKNNLHFTANIIFENHKVHENLNLIKKMFVELLIKCRDLNKKKFKQIDKSSFFLLWRLKDTAVTIHKTNILISNLFENPMNFKNKQINENYLKIFLEYLNVLERQIISFNNHFGVFLKNNKQLVYNSIIENCHSSHWLWIMSYGPNNNVHTMQNNLKKAIEEKKLLNKLDKLIKKGENIKENKNVINHYKELARSNDVWLAMEKQIQNFILIGGGIEEIIDDIVKEYFNDYDTLRTIR